MGGSARKADGESGFALLALIVAIFLILLALTVAAPKVARSLRRDRELETERRAGQYVRAIRLYYKKLGHYPASMEQLEKSNNVRFLRQRYVSPMTGKADWRLIHVGEQKTAVKGFFGKPLTGLATGGLGSAAGLASPGGNGVGAATLGGQAAGTGGGFSLGSSGIGAGGLGSSGVGSGGIGSSGLGSSGLGSSGVGSSGVGSAGGAASAGSDAGTSGTAATTAAGTSGTASGGAFGAGFGSNPGSSSSADSSGSGGPFLGIGLAKEGESILTVNEKTAYNEWEFWYDPRIEQLLGKASLLGGGPAAGGGLGSASGSQSTLGGFGAAPGSQSTFGGGLGTPGAAGGSSTPGSSSAPAGSSTPPPASPQPQP